MRILCHRVEILGDDVRWSRSEKVEMNGRLSLSELEPFSFVLSEVDRLWIEQRTDGSHR